MADIPLKARPVSPRPLSPHLSVFRPLITMVMSIVHRITGVALYVGMILVAGWLIAAASGPAAYGRANVILGSWFGLLVLVGFTWALIHHTLGGVRHMIWDMGHGYSYRGRNGLAWATLVGSVVLTLLFWAVLYAIR